MKRLNGILLPQRKQAAERKIESIPLPKHVCIPMQMHMGSPCAPCVSAGDTVLAGQCIGMASADGAVPVHASVSGTVTAVEKRRCADGKSHLCVEIDSDGAQTLSPDCKPPQITNRAELIAAVRQSGCVGMGGAGRPTYKKLDAAKKFDMLIINGAESEPYLTSDLRQMTEFAGDVLGGIRLLMKLLKIKECRIGADSSMTAAIKLLAYGAGPDEHIRVMPLPQRYPQGAERVVVYHTCGRVIPEDKTSADLGVLVLNVSTCAFLYRYSKDGIPMIDRVVTVGGTAVEKPCNLLVPIGTPMHELLRFAECDFDRTRLLIAGGPMMGTSVSSDKMPVVKPQNGLLAMLKAPNPEPSACMRCGRCMDACPMHLMPMLLERAAVRMEAAKLRKLHIDLCMGCGCCSYVCPAKRPLAYMIRQAKEDMLKAARKEAAK